MSDKPLNRKAYGSIGHLPNSRMGPGDHMITEGQARIATIKTRDRRDRVIVQEKLDGSCTAVAKVDGEIIALGRAGYRAISSKFQQHVMFHDWVMANWQRFDDLLIDGERAVGEWLAQAHGTRYELSARDPWVLFDIMKEDQRADAEEVLRRTAFIFSTPKILATEPITVEEAMRRLGTYGHYGALDPVEGAVWRVERRTLKTPGPEWEVDFLTKYVRPDKVDGLYLPETEVAKANGITEPVWNWKP